MSHIIIFTGYKLRKTKLNFILNVLLKTERRKNILLLRELLLLSPSLLLLTSESYYFYHWYHKPIKFVSLSRVTKLLILIIFM